MNIYNDYELLYMINEFDEEAEIIFYNKYRNLIYKRMNDFKIKLNRRDDFMQEGLFILSNAIRNYNYYGKKSFNKYFDLLLQRRFINILRDEKNYFYNVSIEDSSSIIMEKNSFVYDTRDYDIRGLSSLEKEVIKFKSQNYKPKEIAQVLNCDVKSVYNCLCRIKMKFKKDN